MHRPRRATAPTAHRARTALAVLMLAGTSSAALAQSTVTLFGALDMGMRHVRNDAGTRNSMQSGNSYTSRWGLRGEEDLGGGLKAGFWLESLINGTNGQSGSAQFWDRRSTLSLSGGLGEIRLGRDYTPIFRAFSATDVFSYAGAASMISLYSASASTVVSRAFGSRTTSIARTNGSLQYYTPRDLGGFYANLMVSETGGGSISGDYDYKGARVGYAAGPLDVSVAGGRTRIETDGRNFNIASASATYRLPNKAKLALGVVRMQYMDARQANYSVGIDWPIGVGQVLATYHRLDQSGQAANGASVRANDADVLALGYVHNLSKKTALYGTAAYFRNHGAGRFSVPGGLPGSAAGTHSRGYEAGMRHLF